MKKNKFKEFAYKDLNNFDTPDKQSLMGAMYSFTWDTDPKHIVFTTSRYKFVGKMFDGKNDILEVGCADAWPSRIVKQFVKKLTVSDYDQRFIDLTQNTKSSNFKIQYLQHDMLKGHIKSKKFDGIYSLDVLEHISKQKEKTFIKNICKNLKKNGTLIIGIPSLESQKYSKSVKVKGHINCKSGDDLKRLLLIFFSNVFLFSMNDEVVHTGFNKMANYLICICASKKF